MEREREGGGGGGIKMRNGLSGLQQNQEKNEIRGGRGKMRKSYKGGFNEIKKNNEVREGGGGGGGGGNKGEKNLTIE
jgi:hypothetical protein